MPLHVTLPDGSPLELPDGATALDAAQAIGPRLAKAAVVASVDNEPVDLSHELHDGDQVAIVTLDSSAGVHILRHDAAHVLAQAVLRLWPGTEYAIGPTIENGFYYDFRFAEPISDADFPRIEAEMAKIVAENLPVARRELPRDEALTLFGQLDQPFKVELIEDLPDEQTISIYTQGEFVDLCRGPHLPSTGRVGKGTFKLTSLAGAYWRGDEHNAQLTRIYGTAFAKKEELAAHLEALEMARQRDHRRIGRDLDLFSFHEEGPGFPFFHPKGMRLWNAMIDYWREEHVKAGYEELRTPQILRRELWERSGHWDNYKENMYFTEIDGAPFAIKPMNCPGGLLIYKSRRRSYRDLPHALGRARPGAPPRDERRAARPLPGALLHPGRRPHLLHPRAARRRGARRAALHVAHLRRLRLYRRAHRALDAAGEVDRQRRDVDDRRGGAAQRARELPGRRRHPGRSRDRLPAQPRRRRLLRAQDRLPHPRRHGPQLAVRHHPGRLRHARDASTSPTPAPTTRSTARS